MKLQIILLSFILNSMVMFSQVEKVMTLDKFSEINIDVLGDIEVVESNNFLIKLTYPENEFKNGISIKNKKETLLISAKNNKTDRIIILNQDMDSLKEKRLKIIIHTPFLHKISIKKCNSIRVIGNINKQRLIIEGELLGKMIIDGKQSADLKLKSIGELSITGTSSENDLQIDGISLGTISVNSPLNKLKIISTSIGDLFINSLINNAKISFISGRKIEGLKGEIKTLDLKTNYLLSCIKLNVSKDISIEANHSKCIEVFGKPKLIKKNLDTFSKVTFH